MALSRRVDTRCCVDAPDNNGAGLRRELVPVAFGTHASWLDGSCARNTSVGSGAVGLKS
jgi:hypothetical protein